MRKERVKNGIVSMALINWDKEHSRMGRGENDFDFKQVKLVLPGEHLGRHLSWLLEIQIWSLERRAGNVNLKVISIKWYLKPLQEWMKLPWEADKENKGKWGFNEDW